MAAPTLQPITIDQPLGTPAAEWAQQTVEAIDPNASTGVVTDVSGNPTTNKEKSALGGEPGHGINSNKTGALLEAQKIPPPASSAPVDVEKPLPAEPQSEGPHTETTHAERPQTEPPKLQTESVTQTYTDKHGNPTTDPSASALSGTPGAVGFQPSASSSVASTPGAQLPGGWIRGPESRQNSMLIPETSLYEDVSAALGTVGQAAFSVLPASVVGTLSNNPEQGGANPNATQQGSAANSDSSPPPRSGSPGLLSRAQGMLTGLLARPASPGQKLPAPDAPTTTGGAALVGGGAVAETANQHGDNIAAGQNLGGHNPKGVLGGNTTSDAALVGGGAIARTANEHGDNIAAGHDLGGHDPKGVLADDERIRLEKEASGRVASPEGADTAAKFLNPNVSTPDPSKPPHDPGLSGSVFPVLADDPKKNKKGNKLGSSLSPDTDVQEAASRSNQDFSVPVPDSTAPKSPSSPSAAKSPSSPGGDKAQPKLTKVSDSGVMERLLDAKDVVVAPFAGSRAPRESNELARVSSDPKRDSAPIGPVSANPEGIRTTANPHTAHTGLPPPKEEAGTAHVGGTAVLPSTTKHKDSGASADSTKDLGTTRSATKDTPPAETNNDTGNGSHIPGISTHGEGQGKIHAHEDGGISTGANGASIEKTAPGSPNKGVSRLWSRSRRSVDEGTTTSRTKSRFSEHEPSTGSDSPSAPGSPTSSRFKVPLKDKIKGEIKIISGKVSRNEAKVEQGIALKTGHSHLDDATSPTGNKH